ncbi:hypothetical protein KQX54_001893 [Cotesia glomerata]|uniref:Uncharacterized protein n=1 Tax=Cotesia glomerata TaxID=32391 RepID=A0AAV7ICB8_COTGL|nr:hypothetical protein KQX54_001893 [Cotesia glomerata]
MTFSESNLRGMTIAIVIMMIKLNKPERMEWNMENGSVCIRAHMVCSVYTGIECLNRAYTAEQKTDLEDMGVGQTRIGQEGLQMTNILKM